MPIKAEIAAGDADREAPAAAEEAAGCDLSREPVEGIPFGRLGILGPDQNCRPVRILRVRRGDPQCHRVGGKDRPVGAGDDTAGE